MWHFPTKASIERRFVCCFFLFHYHSTVCDAILLNSQKWTYVIVLELDYLTRWVDKIAYWVEPRVQQRIQKKKTQQGTSAMSSYRSWSSIDNWNDEVLAGNAIAQRRENIRSFACSIAACCRFVHMRDRDLLSQWQSRKMKRHMVHSRHTLT